MCGEVKTDYVVLILKFSSGGSVGSQDKTGRVRSGPVWIQSLMRKAKSLLVEARRLFLNDDMRFTMVRRPSRWPNARLVRHAFYHGNMQIGPAKDAPRLDEMHILFFQLSFRASEKRFFQS